LADALEPCPFCGGTETQITETRLPGLDMGGKERALISATVRHWCEKQPGVVAACIEYRGRDHASAIAAWNKRHLPAPAEVDARVADAIDPRKNPADKRGDDEDWPDWGMPPVTGGTK
jgi:hypothetical protein